MDIKNLKEEYQLQVRNTIIVFLFNELDININDLSAIFKLDKGTVSRIVKKNEVVDKGMLIKVTKAFKPFKR